MCTYTCTSFTLPMQYTLCYVSTKPFVRSPYETDLDLLNGHLPIHSAFDVKATGLSDDDLKTRYSVKVSVNTSRNNHRLKAIRTKYWSKFESYQNNCWRLHINEKVSKETLTFKQWTSGRGFVCACVITFDTVIWFLKTTRIRRYMVQGYVTEISPNLTV